MGAHPQSRGNGEAGRLTPREREVCSMLAQGYTNREMAKELSISERTVETHRANLTSKLGLKSRSELVQFALRNRLIKLI